MQLAAGRQDAAIETLEQIVQRFPASSEAAAAKDRLVAQFRTARQQQTAKQGDPPALRSGPREVKAPAPPSSTPASRPSLAAPAAVTTSPTAALRRGGDDFKLSVGDRIFFDNSTAKIDARQRSVLQAQAAWLKERPEANVKIEGHADDTGTREINAALALERAEAVRAVLIHDGVTPDRIEVIAVGNTRPIAICSVAATASRLCSSQNRRVVTQVEWLDAGYRRRLSSSSGPQSAAAAAPSIGAGRDNAGQEGTAATRPPQTTRAWQR